MRIHHGLEGLRRMATPRVLSVGNFDGVHLGHRAILEECRGLAGGAAGSVAVVTFEPHPLTVLRPTAVPPRLTPATVKERLLAEAGVADLVVLPPDREVLDLTAEAFWQILRDEVRPKYMVEGQSFTFGKGRAGTTERLVEWSAGSGVELRVVAGVAVPLLNLLVAPVSSSLIRWLLGNGRVRDAAICLGRSYVLAGTVVEGDRRGRELGFPTANLDCKDQMIPGDGIYAGACAVGGKRYAAAISVGAPTTFGKKDRRVEMYLVDFAGDLYGQRLEVELFDWLRGMEKFESVEALKEQMGRDVAEGVAIAGRMDGVGAGRAIAVMAR
jgi:riboflavin kinase / FMN adenylyltransferase